MPLDPSRDTAQCSNNNHSTGDYVPKTHRKIRAMDEGEEGENGDAYLLEVVAC